MKTVETFTFSPVNEDSFLGNMNSCILNLSVCKSKACWYYNVVFLSFQFVKAAAVYSRKKCFIWNTTQLLFIGDISKRHNCVSEALPLSLWENLHDVAAVMLSESVSIMCLVSLSDSISCPCNGGFPVNKLDPFQMKLHI